MHIGHDINLLDLSASKWIHGQLCFIVAGHDHEPTTTGRIVNGSQDDRMDDSSIARKKCCKLGPVLDISRWGQIHEKGALHQGEW